MKRRDAWIRFAIVQVVFIAALGVAFARLSSTESKVFNSQFARTSYLPTVNITRKTPLVIEPFYNDPQVVTDEELARVLMKIRPKFAARHLKPNYVEHALRAWSVHAEFQDPEIMSGATMLDFLTDHGKYIASWGNETKPLLQEKEKGVAIRWESKIDASVHHDHWLACLTEAGVSLDQPVFTPTRRDMTINDVLQQALRDFRPDEREVEWSAMAFGLWLAPNNHWRATNHRQLDFDLLAKRLMRGDQKFGVCSGTHRVYSLMLLWRLNDENSDSNHPPMLSPAMRDAVYAHLESVRDKIKVAQFADGHWSSDWSRGADAVKTPIEDDEYKQVIATGHHLEWLAIAPKELHPPHHQIVKAAKWIIKNTTESSNEKILKSYTFYSHVGNALALWRNTHPSKFWKTWQQQHPFQKAVSKPQSVVPPAP